MTQLIFEQLEARQLLAASEVIYRVNAGGNVLAGDPIWEADNSVSPSPYLATVNSTAITTTNASINMSHPSIPVGTPMTVFQSDRYDKPSGSEMEYNFPVTPGDYEVRLYFAETWSGAQAPGIRVFDVTIEGVTRLDNYDIFADAGGFAGVVKSFPVTNTDGSLDVKFLHQLQNPTIRGLEILREPVLAGSVLEASVNSLDFGLVPLGQTGTQVVTLTNSAPLGGAAITVNPTSASIDSPFDFDFGQTTPIVLAPGQATNVTLSYSPDSPTTDNGLFVLPHSGDNSPLVISLTGTAQQVSPDQVLYRVNTGGILISGMPDWTADTKASPSPYLGNTSANTSTAGTSLPINITHPSIPMGTPQAIFQSERYDITGQGEMTYNFPVAPGQYQVRLYFAETWSGGQAPGLRVFDVSIEGVTALDNYDIYAEVGGYAGVVKSFSIASDSMLNIEFLHVTQNPAVKAIEVLSVSSGSVLVPSDSTVDFGLVSVGQTANTSLTLTNNAPPGGASITVNPAAVTVSGPFGFSFGQTAPIVLAPGQTANVTLSYTPTAAGTNSGSLTIPHTGSNSPLTIELTGSGQAATGGQVLYRVNAGGLTLAGNPNWQIDNLASPSPYFSNSSQNTAVTSTTATISMSHPSIPAGTPMALFQMDRFDKPGLGEMGYDFPVAPGQYEVRLYFAETWSGAQAAGVRQFDVQIEGATVLDNYDIYADVGGFKGVVKSFTVNSDANLDIDFLHVLQNPTIRGIEILSDGVGTIPINFTKSQLNGTTGLTRPTSLQFGPDGRLYVSQQNGLLNVYDVIRNGANNYQVVAAEQISLVKQIFNHDDNGSVNPLVTSRLVTGMLVTGTANNPVIYVTSSDPRIGGGSSGADKNLDTNSGIVSRLTWNGSSWQKLDLVRGLPRSEENHGPNGLQLDPATNTLYVAYGGHTNQGGPSFQFAYLPEFALSAAILAIDLNAIGNSTYDLPTLNDENRPGVNDANDPFGGNDGNNQAKLVPGGPVKVYAPGFRNPYDLIITSSGRMYTFDNGSNAGWGSPPVGEGPGGNATNDPVGSNNPSFGDGLHFITGPGYYGGHPNPTRSNPANTFNASNPQSPVSVANPIESDFRGSNENGALVVFNHSTNGIAEYTAANFGGAMQGDLLAAGYNNTIQRIKLNAAGNAVVLAETLFNNVGGLPIDVTTPVGALTGTIWAADLGAGAIIVFEPSDGLGGTAGDSDGDCYSDLDENAAGTNPFNGADVPTDYDGDCVSDVTDPDDDGDNLADLVDAFAIDAANGNNTPLYTLYGWENDEPNPGGLLGLGFTGAMTNGVDDYHTLFDPDQVTAGGAAGVFTIDAAGAGTALGTTNTQTQALQFGVQVASATGPFLARTRLLDPFGNATPQAGQQMGFYIGTGTQDDYIKLVVDGSGGGSVLVLKEVGGAVQQQSSQPLGVPTASINDIDLMLWIDPLTNVLQASYRINQGPSIEFGPVISVPSAWLASSLAIGVLAVDSTNSGALPVTWDFLGFEPSAANLANGEALVRINNSSTFQSGSFRISNNSTGGKRITSAVFDLRTGFLRDMVFDPDGVAGDAVAKSFTPDSGATQTGLVGYEFLSPHDGGFDVLSVSFDNFDAGEEFTFSLDVDPTSIRGASQPGPAQSGAVSGLELSGTTVMLSFDDGQQLSGQTFRVPGSNNDAEKLFGLGAPAAPTIALAGVPSLPRWLRNTSQTVVITGTAGSQVRLLHVEGGLFLDGVPNGGFDIDLFEANKAIFVDEQTVTIGPSGTALVGVTLRKSQPEGGINHLFAVVVGPDAMVSNLSNVMIVDLNPPARIGLDGPSAPQSIEGSRHAVLPTQLAVWDDVGGLPVEASQPSVSRSLPPRLDAARRAVFENYAAVRHTEPRGFDFCSLEDLFATSNNRGLLLRS